MLAHNDVEVSACKTGTCTVICKSVTSRFDIVRLAKFVDLDDVCTGVAATFSGGQVNVARGTAVNKRQFPNQTTLHIRLSDNHRLKVKVFSGSLQIPGCRSEVDAREALNIVLKKYSDLSNREDDTQLVRNGGGRSGPFVGASDKIVYSGSGEAIGYKTAAGHYYLKRQQVTVGVDPDCGCFAELCWSSSRKRLWTFNGRECGAMVLRDTSGGRLKLKAGDEVCLGAVLRRGTAIGHVHIEWTVSDVHCVLQLPWVCVVVPQVSTDWEFQTPLVHSTFRVMVRIDQKKVSCAFVEAGYDVAYDPTIFHGILLRYLFPVADLALVFHDGKCTCDNDERCTCSEASLMLFATGTVIVTGLRSERQALLVRAFVKDFLERLLPD